MKRTILFLLSLLQVQVYAQPSVVEEAKGRIKLSDAVSSYLSKEHPFVKDEDKDDEGLKKGRDIKEGNDYHFGRWLWYWKLHTDENGYMVSEAKTWDEWNKYFGKGAQAKTTDANLSNWQAMGPTTTTSGYRGIGRINALAFHPTNSGTFWVGSAGGGVWRTIDNGANWTCLTDKLPVLSVSDIDVNPKNPNTLYLCTGDRDSRDHFSIGVLKSTDGGANWDTTGLKWDAMQLRLTNTLVINDKDTNSLIVATSEGIYKSYDAGAHWTNVLPGNFKQVLYHPTDTNIVYATSFYTVANGTPAQIYRSKDGGANWQQVTNLSQSWRITLAVCPGDVRIVKAVVATYDPNNYRGLKGIYSSGDTGKNFSLVHAPASNCGGNILTNDVSGSSCGGQGNYDLAIAMDPANPNKVYVGGVNTWYSPDGGNNWTIINQWTGFLAGVKVVHADKHFLGFHPLVPQRLFECNDGGIYWTDNPQSTLWSDVTFGLGITQFYRNAVCDATTFVVGGAQDNGSRTYEYVTNTWDDASGGDGMDCQIDPSNNGVFYTGVQYGVIYRNDGFSLADISNNIPGNPTGAWITPYIISPTGSDHLLAGYQYIYFSSDQGNNWSPITVLPLVSPDKNILRLAMTPADVATIYAIPDSSNQVYYTHSFSPSSQTSFSQLNVPYTGMISDIKVDAKDKDHFWITFSGFNSPQVAEYNSGTWKQINTNLPNVPILCFEADSTNGIIYVGTDIGVFYLDSVNKQWEPFNFNLPAVHVTDLGINYVTGKIWAATYGRGMWSSKKQEYNNGISLIPYAADAFNLYPNPNKGKFSVMAKVNVSHDAVSLRLIDYTGKTTWHGKGTFENNKLDIDVTGVAAGTYIFEVSDLNSVVGRQRVTVF